MHNELVASVQYGDMVGTVKADEADGISLYQKIISLLPQEHKGDVVGVKLYAIKDGEIFVSALVRVSDTTVKSVSIPDVKINDVLCWFKRLNVVLLNRNFNGEAITQVENT